MRGGLIQIATRGCQDLYLSGQPEITFFKAVYKRHTNFANEYRELPFVGEIAFGNKLHVKIDKNADLVSKMCVRIKLGKVVSDGNNFAWTKRLGHAMLKTIDITIGNNIIDHQCGTWLDIWYELTKKGNHEKGYDIMIGNIREMIEYNTEAKPEYVLYVPLQFWFTKFYNQSIPIIALNNQDINIIIEIEKLEKLIITSKNFTSNDSIKIQDISLLVNYIYLDNVERTKFAKSSHQYLIEQVENIVQVKVRSNVEKYKIHFNKLVKEMFWISKKFAAGDPYIYYEPNIRKKDYTKFINRASKKLLYESITLDLSDTNNCANSERYVKIFPYAKQSVNLVYFYNKSKYIVYYNSSSLLYKDFNYLDSIGAEVIVGADKIISIMNITSGLTISDLSISTKHMCDTRFENHDPMVWDHFNYGMNIDGTINITKYAELTFNGETRVNQREGEYFNYIEPEKRHSNIPKDGINIYSFSIYPEEYQPSGYVNFGQFDNVVWELQYRSKINIADNIETLFYCTNYNYLKFADGVSGLINN